MDMFLGLKLSKKTSILVLVKKVNVKQYCLEIFFLKHFYLFLVHEKINLRLRVIIGTVI